jgi:hypothetical protein
MSAISWVPEEQIVYTTEITVGVISTLIFLANRSVVATRTQTDYQWHGAPDNMYPPYLTEDRKGTAMAMAVFTNAGSTTVLQLAYPTPYVDYATEYSWVGTLPTHERAGSLLCASATPKPSIQRLSEHYIYPQPIGEVNGSSNISSHGYRPLWVPIDIKPDETFFEAAFPSEAAFASCRPITADSSALTIFSTPKFIFEHKTVMTSFETPIQVLNGSSVTGCANMTTSTASGIALKTGISNDLNPQHDACGDENDSMFMMIVNEDGWRMFRGGYGPHYESTVSSFEVETGDRVYAERTRSSWNEQEESPTGNSQYFPHIVYDWGEVPKHSAGAVRIEKTATGWFNAPPGSQITEPPSNPDTKIGLTDLEAIASYFNEHTEYRIRPVSPPQSTERPGAHELNHEPSDMEIIASYFNEHPEYQVKPIADAQSVQNTPSKPNLVHTNVAVVVNEQAADFPSPESIVEVGLDPSIAAEFRPTELAAPVAIFTQVPTTVNGILTTIPAYIISGSSTATIGQTVTINNNPTVLAVPALAPIYVPTTVNGVATSTLAYLVSGSVTATIGQKVMIKDRPTVLAAPDSFLESVLTTVGGVTTRVPMYVIGGSVTATVGQTITLAGRTTVLSWPTTDEGDLVLVTGTTRTGNHQNDSVERWRVSYNVALLSLGAVWLIWL